MSPSPSAPNARYAPAWLAVVLLLGCEETVVPIVTFTHPTLIEVSPSAFLGDVPCIDAPGAMRRYVATVFDVGSTGEAAGGAGGAGGEDGEGSTADDFALPSSTLDRGDEQPRPIPCTQGVAFSRIVPGHRYRAEVDGYDRDDLVALAPGLRILVDPATSERVAPRWTTSCAKKSPITGLQEISRSMESCEPLEDAAPGAATLVEVRIDRALGDLECGSSPGAVERFEVTLPDGSTMGAACDEAVTVSGLEPGPATLTLPLRAFEAGETEPTWGSNCLVEVIKGVTASATCLRLEASGALEVDPRDALAVLGLECAPQAFAELDIAMTEEPNDERHVATNECMTPVRFQARTPGLATARASVRFADGSRSAAALCSGDVRPGETVLATCTEGP